ncbi:MAG: hypothetical protein WA885_24445 [Phormidesmis sp.]
MPATTANKTNFWIVCCEETEANQQILAAVSDWKLPGVKSLLASELPANDQLAAADYAIFVTPHGQPRSQVSVSPLSIKSGPKSDIKSDTISATGQEATAGRAPQCPVSLLSDVHSRYGQSPQSWWLQLPTTEVRAQRVQPVSTQKTVAQALNQIEIFVRNYRLSNAPIADDRIKTRTTIREAVLA